MPNLYFRRSRLSYNSFLPALVLPDSAAQFAHAHMLSFIFVFGTVLNFILCSHLNRTVVSLPSKFGTYSLSIRFLLLSLLISLLRCDKLTSS